MTRIPVLALAALLFAPHALAETVTGVDNAVIPVAPADGTMEMKWDKVDRIPFPCIAGNQICTCFVGSDVIDCRKPIPIEKKAD